MTADTVNRKGTPGPWGIERTKNDWWVGQLGPDGKVDLIVARFPTGSEYSETYTDRQKSDAQLVAAAPELLEFSKLYMAAVQQMNDAMKDGLNVHGAIAELVGAEDMLNHAIAKAEGRS